MKRKLLIGLFIMRQSMAAEVDLLSGGLVADLTLPIPNAQDEFVHVTYFSRTSEVSALGFGWCGEWSAKLEEAPNQHFKLIDCKGQEFFEPGRAKGSWRSHFGSQIVKGPAGYQLRRPNGDQLWFDFNLGLLHRQNGDSTESFEYGPERRLIGWQRGPRLFRFHYAKDGQLKEITLGGRTMSAFRQSGQDLVEIKTNSERVRFDYDELHNLIRLQSPKGEGLRAAYDLRRDQVSRLEAEDGCVESFRRTHDVLSQQTLSQYTCPNGTGETFFFEVRKRPELNSVPEGMRWRRIRNGQGNVLSGAARFDEVGRMSEYEDQDQRLLYQYSRSGRLKELARLAKTETQSGPKWREVERAQFTYDLEERLISYKSARSGKIDFKYDNGGRLQDLKIPRAPAGKLESGNKDALALDLVEALASVSPLWTKWRL